MGFLVSQNFQVQFINAQYLEISILNFLYNMEHISTTKILKGFWHHQRASLQKARYSLTIKFGGGGLSQQPWADPTKTQKTK